MARCFFVGFLFRRVALGFQTNGAGTKSTATEGLTCRIRERAEDRKQNTSSRKASEGCGDFHHAVRRFFALSTGSVTEFDTNPRRSPSTLKKHNFVHTPSAGAAVLGAQVVRCISRYSNLECVTSMGTGFRSLGDYDRQCAACDVWTARRQFSTFVKS